MRTAAPGAFAAVSSRRRPAALDPPGGGLSLGPDCTHTFLARSGLPSAPWSSVCCSRRRAGSVQASSGRSKLSSGPSSCTGRLSTCASRSCTTSTSCAISSARGAVFVESEESVPEGATLVLSAHGVAPAVRAGRGRRSARDDRRDVPARHEGARGDEALRGRGLHRRPDRPRGPRGGRRHPGARRPTLSASSARSPRRRRSRCPIPARIAYVTQTTLSVDETAEIVAVLQAPVPGDRAPPTRGHLLRDDEPPGRGQGARGRGRPAARDRLGEQLELEAARRGRAGGGRRVAPDRRRDRDRRALARRARDGRRHGGRLGAGAARRRASATGSAPAA